MSLRLGYNTNGFPQHRVEDVAELLAEIGYAGIAITPDVFHLDPLRDGRAQARALQPRLAESGLAVAVETGARFLLDPRRKHQPTLLSDAPGRARRLELLTRCLEIAVELRAETFSFWSGSYVPSSSGAPADRDELLDRLCEGAAAVLDRARGSGLTVCFEPEPGMFVATLDECHAFFARLNRPELAIMLDVSHVPVTESLSAHEAVASCAERLGGLQLADAQPGVHAHLFPGEGVVDWDALRAVLARIGYRGLATLELPRHGHDPVVTARAAFTKLRG